MVITKTLALKGMYGLMAVGATVGSVFYLRSQLSYSDTDSEVEKLSVVELLGKVGLDCGIASDEELTDTTSKDCSVKTEGSINVKVGEKSEEGVSFSSSGTSKLKVSKEEGYPKKLKFVVDSGDLELSKTGGTSSIPKLEQFETYEIRRKGGKFYLSRRREAWGEKKRILGLGKCTLPKEGDSECTLGREEIKGVKFDNHSGVTVSNGDVKLKISRVEDTASFPENYRFTFTFPQEVTINSKKIKANTPYDFKIKKKENSNTLTLEPAWTADSLAKKVGLSCTSSNECTIPESGGNLRVKQLSDHDNVIKQTALTKKVNGGGNGKIKVTEDVEGYNQGFKFEIEGGSIELSGTTGTDESDQITRLGEYETYEIKEESDGWYLAIKDKADVFVLEQLGLTNVNGCSSLRLPRGSSGSDCRIEDISVLKKIKFGNASKHTWSSSAKVDVQLMIYQDSSLPVGFKFTFTNSSSTSLFLPDGNEGKVEVNSSNNAGVDYKIRKSTNGGTTTLCLEKKDGTGSSSGCSK